MSLLYYNYFVIPVLIMKWAQKWTEICEHFPSLPFTKSKQFVQTLNFYTVLGDRFFNELMFITTYRLKSISNYLLFAKNLIEIKTVTLSIVVIVISKTVC